MALLTAKAGYLPRGKKSSLDFHPMTSYECRAVAGSEPGGVTAAIMGVADARYAVRTALHLDNLRMLWQPEVRTNLLELLAGTSTTHHEDRDIRQRDAPASVTSSVAISVPLSMRGWNRTLNTRLSGTRSGQRT